MNDGDAIGLSLLDSPTSSPFQDHDHGFGNSTGPHSSTNLLDERSGSSRSIPPPSVRPRPDHVCRIDQKHYLSITLWVIWRRVGPGGRPRLSGSLGDMPVDYDAEESLLTIGDGLGTVVIFGPGRDPFHDGYDFVDFPVTLSSDGLSATTIVRSVEGPSQMALGLFMDDLASEWKGLQFERTWESIEHDLTIEVRSDPLGHLMLTFELRESHEADVWSARVTVKVEPGEEMAQVAAAARLLLRPTGD